MINPVGNPCFAKIYALAHADAIKGEKRLKASGHQKRGEKRFIEEQNYLNLIHKLKQNKESYDRFTWALPSCYFVEWERACSYSPFDLMDEERIFFKEDGFIFLRNTGIMPMFRTIND